MARMPPDEPAPLYDRVLCEQCGADVENPPRTHQEWPACSPRCAAALRDRYALSTRAEEPPSGWGSIPITWAYWPLVDKGR
jgi:endogenous inhibitor of DNA gyrase (YacG/DUF329 family)